MRSELAAWRLDRLLGLGIVPVTVERELQGRKGMLQARPRNGLTQAAMRPGSIASPSCSSEPQFQLMYVLDTLTGNEQRTPESILYDADNGMLFTTSFSQAFGRGRGLPSWLRARPPHRARSCAGDWRCWMRPACSARWETCSMNGAPGHPRAARCAAGSQPAQRAMNMLSALSPSMSRAVTAMRSSRIGRIARPAAHEDMFPLIEADPARQWPPVLLSRGQ